MAIELTGLRGKVADRHAAAPTRPRDHVRLSPIAFGWIASISVGIAEIALLQLAGSHAVAALAIVAIPMIAVGARRRGL
jgi:hypothetical protein